MHNPTNTKSLRAILGIGILCLSLMGCQVLQTKNPGELSLKNHDFIGLWNAYNDCQTGSNTQKMKVSLEILHSAPKPISLDDSPIPIPKFIKDLTSTRNSRLAVDPRAMAASCAIHLATVALHTAEWDMAIHTFQSIVDQYPEPQYAFYVSEASRAIADFSSIRPVSLSSRDSLVH